MGGLFYNSPPQTEDKLTHRKNAGNLQRICDYTRNSNIKILESLKRLSKSIFAYFVNRPSTVPYANTLSCVVLTHLVCSLYGILAVRTPTASVDDFDRTGQNQWLTCVFHRLTVCRQMTLSTHWGRLFCNSPPYLKILPVYYII